MIEVNGINVWHRITGEGEPVVQIHGAGFGHYNLDPVTPLIADAGFMVVMNGLESGAPNGALSESSIFKLGFCAGRLGIKRMCLMHSSGHGAGGDGHGLPHVPVDPSGGWQLHLARQMKRAGCDVDLNRLA